MFTPRTSWVCQWSCATIFAVHVFNTLHHSYIESCRNTTYFVEDAVDNICWFILAKSKEWNYWNSLLSWIKLSCIIKERESARLLKSMHSVSFIFWCFSEKTESFYDFLLCLSLFVPKRKMTRKSHTRRVLTPLCTEIKVGNFLYITFSMINNGCNIFTVYADWRQLFR